VYSDSADASLAVPVSASTRCNLVYVPQGNSLFSGTIRDNLLVGNPDATDQQMEEALGMCKKALKGKAMMSIVAGCTIERLKKAIDGGKPRILRLLPNTPALVFEGAFGLCKETDFTDEEKEFAVNLYESIGVVEWVKEYDIDAICGLSGGGPAYAAMFIEALADGGVKQGLTRPVAMKMAAQTVLGTAKLILETGMHPGALKDMVSSPAGTTIEGVEKLEEGGMRSAVMKAVVAATDRSREL
jgi:pyrroline-5-carboxylate reductase